MTNRPARLLFASVCLLCAPTYSLAATMPRTGSAIAAVAAAPAAPSATDISASIAALEKRLFELTYAGEDDDARLTRIEKFVFGGRQTGSAQVRISRLQSAIASNPAASAQPETPPKTKAPASDNADATQATTSAASDAVTANSSFAYGNYPRVTELEKDILGTTYEQEHLPQRLARLETKAFGAPSKSDDLCARVDTLDQYADRHDIFKDRHDPLVNTKMANPPRPSNFGYNNPMPGSGWGFGFPLGMMDGPPGDNSDDSTPKPPVNPFINGVTGTDQRLSAMEEFTYGHNYATRPVQDRLARLEKRLVPYEHNLAGKDVTTRVNNLWSILSLANTMQSAPTAAHKGNMIAANAPSSTPTAPAPDSASQTAGGPPQPIFNNGSSAPHSWLHQLAKTAGSPAAGNN